MTRIKLVSLCQHLLAQQLAVGDVAIDATVGNGYDTAFLATQVGSSGKVYGFDLQAAALQATNQRLQQLNLLDRVDLYQASHHQMLDWLPARLHGRCRAVMFNLGYLPGGDKTLITQAATTLPALDAACQVLMPTGMLTVIAYPGHAGGDQENRELANWLAGLEPARFEQQLIESDVGNPSAPRLFVVRKRR